ncbi:MULTISPECIES: hypothetical protein [Salinibaculum]|uniref:hypothetical protein n=1 Tax=Salinibaculum TaxID=2732368 RepID=UPI0030CCEEC2
MPADFTYEMYGTLLDACRESDYAFLTVREYLAADALPERFVVLRHDVDRKPDNALDFARIEAERDVASTYYVRTVPDTFDPEVICEIDRLGHEIGYHYEDLDRADGDVTAARRSFGAHLAKLRSLVDVDTVCMHGNPLTPHDNREMWNSGDGLAAHDLAGEAYLSMDFTDVHYYSDTGRTWRDGPLKIKDHTVGGDAKTTQVDTTPDLVDLITSRSDGRFCLLTHPDRWTATLPERVFETTFDAAKNTAKYGLQALRSLPVGP